MTLVKAYTLTCEAPGCPARIGGVAARAGRSGEAAHRMRALASANGWRRRADDDGVYHDLCPTHAK